ncbi:unnamed protein product [Zymoseptoria tritici ST99CH_3D1]|nr:unnamed protein product [Zymoseptoria tritici ST99CH_3D1]
MSFNSATSRDITTVDPLSTSTSSRSIAIAIATPPSCSSSRRESFNAPSSISNPYSSCAYSSWQSSSSGHKSAYVSDEDLWGNDDEAYLSEPPPPPRSAEVWLARPLLPPVVPIKPRRCSTEPKKERRSSSTSSKRKT